MISLKELLVATILKLLHMHKWNVNCMLLLADIDNWISFL